MCSHLAADAAEGCCTPPAVAAQDDEVVVACLRNDHLGGIALHKFRTTGDLGFVEDRFGPIQGFLIVVDKRPFKIVSQIGVVQWREMDDGEDRDCHLVGFDDVDGLSSRTEGDVRSVGSDKNFRVHGMSTQQGFQKIFVVNVNDYTYLSGNVQGKFFRSAVAQTIRAVLWMERVGRTVFQDGTVLALQGRDERSAGSTEFLRIYFL